MRRNLRLLISSILLTLIFSCSSFIQGGELSPEEKEMLADREAVERVYPQVKIDEKKSYSRKKKSFFTGTVEYRSRAQFEGGLVENRLIIERGIESSATQYRALRADIIEELTQKNLLYRSSNDFYSYGELSHFMEGYSREEKDRARTAVFTFRKGRVVYSLMISGKEAWRSSLFEELVKDRVKGVEAELASYY